MTAWKQPTRARVERIRDVLREYYGRPRNDVHRAPLDELVLTVLSQNTNDRNRDVAFMRLRARFPSWAQVAHAPLSEIEEAIRPGGISKVKSGRIKDMLLAIEERAGDLELGWLASVPRERAIEFLTSLPGVGRKTAACVLLFSFDRPEMPVDTHVQRVSARLGLTRPKASLEQAHDMWLELARPDEIYELHTNLLRHGRRICAAQRPKCEQCPLKRLCPYGKSVLAAKRAKPAGGPRRAAKLKRDGRRR